MVQKSVKFKKNKSNQTLNKILDDLNRMDHLNTHKESLKKPKTDRLSEKRSQVPTKKEQLPTEQEKKKDETEKSHLETLNKIERNNN